MGALLFIGAGGALGAIARYLTSTFAHSLAGVGFPFGTLLVNFVGCLLIGFLGAGFEAPTYVREEYRLAVVTGFLGGFTTFSAFGFETLALWNQGQKHLVVANILLNNGLALTGVWVGYRLGERAFSG